MSDWINKYKGSGRWPFTPQGDKWGYLNNKRWTEKSDAIIFSQNKGLGIDLSNEHNPCGHWHKPPPGVPFNVGRLYGWDSIYDYPWAFGWDVDYKRVTKVDLETLNAIDYVSVVPGKDPLWGEDVDWKLQIIDACDLYVYHVFYSWHTLEVYKINVYTMAIEASCHFFDEVAFATTEMFCGCADLQYLYLAVGDYLIILPTDLTWYVKSEVAASMKGSMQIDPALECIFANGVTWGVKQLSIFDLSVEKYTHGDIYGWESCLHYIAKYGIGFSVDNYHPFSQMLYWFTYGGVSVDNPTEYEFGNFQSGNYSDWADNAIYTSCLNFFNDYITRIYRFQYNGDWDIYFEHDDEQSPGFCSANPEGRSICTIKPTGYVIAKNINYYSGSQWQRPIGTYLSKFNPNLDITDWQHKVEGLQGPGTELQEPQIWTPEHNKWIYPPHWAGI